MFSDERDLTRMERNREGKRGSMTAMNGSLPRKKQRSSSVLRDYPEDGVMEMHERLRDRGAKKDRDRDRDRERLSRSKRRRVERMMHGSGGHRDDMEESSEESIEEEMDDDEVVEKPPQNHQHQHQTLRVPPWDEINVSIPRKARTRGATAKRSHEHWVSSGGGGGCSGSGAGGEGEQPSPVRSSPSATQFSPPSSKIKQFNGSNQHAHEMAKDPSTADELEIAELLTGMRSHEDHSVRFDNRDANGVSNEGKSPVRDQSPANPSSMATALKRKRPRHAAKYDDECPPSTLRSSPAKVVEDQPAQEEPVLPKSESLGQFLSNENGGSLQDLSALRVVDGEPKQEKLDSSVVTAASNREESKEQVILPQKEATSADFGRTVTTTFYAISPATKNLRKDKVTIDLMAPPDGSSDFISDDRPVAREVSEVSTEKREAKVSEREAVNQSAGESLLINGGKTEKSITSEDFGLKKQLHKGKTLDLHKGKTLDLQLDLENSDKLASNKHDPPKQPVKSSMGDPHSGKTGPPLSMPTTVAGWPGSFPQFGYMGQVPPFQAIMPAMDAAAGSRSILQKLPSHPVRRKRCSLHGYIAQSIEYHQKMMQMNPYYPASAGAAQLFGPRPSSNLNGMPPVDPLLGNPFQGSYPGRSLQDSKGAPIFTTFTGHPLNVNTTEAAHRTQLVLQQMPPQPGSANNMIPSPALFYPINQHQAVAAGAAAAAAAAVRSGVDKSSLAVGTATSSSGMSSSAVASSGGGGSAVAMNYGCSPEQYLAMLQNGGYPIPIPAHVGGPPSYRGGAPSSSMPLFGGPFFQSQMLHLSQLQQKQHQQQYQQLPLLASAPQKPLHSQPSHQNTSTSSGSSSSQKHQQMLQQGSGGGANGAGTNSHNLQSKKQHPQLPSHHARQMESKLACEDGPSSSDSRALQAPKTAKSLYNHNMAMPIHPQNAAAVAPAAAASTLSNGAGYHEKQPTQQQQPAQPALKADLTSSQAFAMSYAANNGGATPSGIDYSSVAQGHAMFHSFPEMARHGYPMNMAAAAAVASSVQQKKANSQAVQGGKSAGSSVINANNVGHEERKMMSASFKSHGISGMQHTSSFSKTDKEPQINNFMGNSVIESSSGRQATNPASANSARPANRSTNTTISPGSAQSNPNFQQFQLHRQAELQMQHHMASARAKSTSGNNGGVYPERAPSGSTTAKFPQTMTGFQQGFAHSGSPTQPPQWKPSGRTGTATPTTSADPFASRNHPQQQAKSGITSSHHTHISFSPNAVKMPAGAQHPPGSGTTNVHASSAATPTATGDIGSPSHSISKSTGGSPRASTSEKPTSGANTQALSGQSYTKISASNSSRKSSPNRNASSNLGNPQQINPVTNSSNGGKQLSQLPQFRLQPQQLTQKRSQLLFSNGTYMQAHTSQSATAASAAAAANFYKQQTEQQQAHTSQSTTAASAAAAANFYKQQTEQQQQYQNQSSNPASSGLTLVGTSATSDPSKASTTNANSMKGMPPPGLLHAAQMAAAAGTGHPLMSAMFPYMPMPSTAAKPGDQKPAAGNDNLNASWQPEKKA